MVLIDHDKSLYSDAYWDVRNRIALIADNALMSTSIDFDDLRAIL